MQSFVVMECHVLVLFFYLSCGRIKVNGAIPRLHVHASDYKLKQIFQVCVYHVPFAVFLAGAVALFFLSFLLLLRSCCSRNALDGTVSYSKAWWRCFTATVY